jgi:ABC-type multidrug transport system fused ATPase/permease subunit
MAVRDASLSLRFGECVALVGPSGHGKSTLVDLATGLIAPDAGEVRIDGTPLAALDLVRWQRTIGLVPQDAPLLHGSVRENLVFGEAGPADEARLREALALADAAEFVAALPEGLDTPLGERGAQLSGGQRQRLALARALYRRPRLLILDEATSALDAATAARVVDNLRSLKGETTMLLVSHAEDLLRLADRVLNVEAGRVFEPARPRERAG